jgi:hypothetical protein
MIPSLFHKATFTMSSCVWRYPRPRLVTLKQFTDIYEALQEDDVTVADLSSVALRLINTATLRHVIDNINVHSVRSHGILYADGPLKTYTVLGGSDIWLTGCRCQYTVVYTYYCPVTVNPGNAMISIREVMSPVNLWRPTTRGLVRKRCYCRGKEEDGQDKGVPVLN